MTQTGDGHLTVKAGTAGALPPAKGASERPLGQGGGRAFPGAPAGTRPCQHGDLGPAADWGPPASRAARGETSVVLSHRAGGHFSELLQDVHTVRDGLLHRGETSSGRTGSSQGGRPRSV